MAKVNPFRFSAKYQDDESDLLYYGYRYLNASTGRWLSRDPIEEVGGLNLYCLIQNDSINDIDSLGHESFASRFDSFTSWFHDTHQDHMQRLDGTWDNAVFFYDWVFDKGSADRTYGENDNLTKLLMKSNGAKDITAQYRAKNCPPSLAGGYDTIQGYKDTFFHWGFLNPAEWQIGGFLFTITRDGPCKVKYVVTNSATRRSFFGEPTMRHWANHMGINWTPWGLQPRDQVSWGGEIKQTFTWEDVSPCCCGKKKTRSE